MAYGDITLGADHRWSFDNVLTDSIGSLNVSNSGGTLSSTPLTRGSTHSYQTNGRDDLATVAPDSTTGSTGLSQFAFQGWFQVSQIQGPPVLIFKTGGSTAGFALFMWAGNNVMLQVKDVNANDAVQIFSDVALSNNRPYHFFVRYSGSSFNNEIEFYIDGRKQIANRNGVLPGASAMTPYTGNITWGENGTTSIDVTVGSLAVLIKAPVNGFWSEWWTWSGAGSDAITQPQLKDVLFASGAIPDFTITSGTQSQMQAQADTISSTLRPNVPLCISVEEINGGGDLNLSLDNVTFNALAGMHIEYQGTGTLFLTNTNGSNASLGTSNVTFLNPAQLTITGLQNPTEVRVYVSGTQTEIAGEESVNNGTFSATISQSPIDIRFISLEYQINKLENVPITSNLSIEASQFLDRQYSNT